jgi:hypothetical protein
MVVIVGHCGLVRSQGVAWLGPQLHTSSDNCFIVGLLSASKGNFYSLLQDAQKGRQQGRSE